MKKSKNEKYSELLNKTIIAKSVKDNKDIKGKLISTFSELENIGTVLVDDYEEHVYLNSAKVVNDDPTPDDIEGYYGCLAVIAIAVLCTIVAAILNYVMK